MNSQKGMMALLMAMGLAGTFSLVTIVGYQTQQTIQQNSQNLTDAVDRDQLFNTAKSVLSSREYCSAILGRNSNADPNLGTNLYNMISGNNNTSINFNDGTLQATLNGFNATNNSVGLFFSRMNANSNVQNRKDLNKDYSINSFIFDPDEAWGVQVINGVNHRRARLYIDVRAQANQVGGFGNNNATIGKVYGRSNNANSLDAKEELYVLVSEATAGARSSECWLQSGFSNDTKGDLYSQCLAQNNDQTNVSNSTYCAMTRKVASTEFNYAIGSLDAVPDYKVYSNETLSKLSSERNFADAICDTEIELMKYNPKTKTNTAHVAQAEVRTVTNPQLQPCLDRCSTLRHARWRRTCANQCNGNYQPITETINCEKNQCPAANTSGIALREANTLWTMMCKKPKWNGCVYKGRYLVNGEAVATEKIWNGKAKHVQSNVHKVVERNMSLRGVRALNQLNKMASTNHITQKINTEDRYDRLSDDLMNGNLLGVNALLGGIDGALVSISVGVIIKEFTRKCDGAYIDVDLRCVNGYMEADRIIPYVEQAHVKMKHGIPRIKCKYHSAGVVNPPTVADILNGSVNANTLFEKSNEFTNEMTDDEINLQINSQKALISGAQNLTDLYSVLIDNEPDIEDVRSPSSSIAYIDPDVLSAFQVREEQLWQMLNQTISTLNTQLNSTASTNTQALQSINSSLRASIGNLSLLITQFATSVEGRELISANSYNEVVNILSMINAVATSANANSTTRQLANEAISVAHSYRLTQ